MILSFTVAGAPRTKKTHQRIVTIKPKGGRPFHKVMPSEAYLEWFDNAMSQAPTIRRTLLNGGYELPIKGPVSIRATFYRERLSGDATGFYQALADWLQESRINENGRTTRNGAGIIEDDSQIGHWDGSRLAKDANCPRIVVEIEVLGEHQGELLELAGVSA